MGRIVENTIKADDKAKAQQLLEKDGLTPIRIELAAGPRRSGLAHLFQGRVRDEEIIAFTRQLGTMLKAGLPILQTLQVLKQQSDNPRLREICGEVSDRISGGAKLSEALTEFPRTFSPQYVNIVRSGESGADLVQSLDSLADWMERELEIKTEVKAAIRYPMFVLTAMLLVSILLVSFIIPRFATLFSRSGIPLPLPTRMLMKGNDVFQHYWPILIVALGLIIAGFVFLLKVPFIRRKVDEWKFYMPVFGPIYSKIAISRFSHILSMLVRSGVPLLRSLEVAPGVVDNAYLSELVRSARRNIQNGSSIADGFRQMPILPPMVASLVAIGEKTGAVDDMLDHLVAQYDRDVRYALKTLSATIEPIITVTMGIGVLFLALALFLPIWNMSRTIIRP
jgi:MSHA biogenesis protein MshG